MHTLIRIFIFVALFVLIDIYVARALYALFDNQSSLRIFKWVYWGIHTAFWLTLIGLLFFVSRKAGINNWMARGVMGFFIFLYIPKLLLALFLLIQDTSRLFASVLPLLKGEALSMPDRRKFITQLSVLVAAIPMGAVLHGIWKGRFKFTIHRQELKFKDLPDAFDGFTLTQLSDIHIGSFDNKEELERGLKMANDLKSDIIVFTGDLVNNVASEAEPWISSFQLLKAPLGVYSILGNHDYGDYVQWESREAKMANLELLKKYHADSGFKLLLNEHTIIEKSGQTIALVGLENWGAPPFPQYGNMKKATAFLEPDTFKILLSHDPTHWDLEAKNHPSNISLSLAGHTHGMQFGVEIPWLKWSPVKFKYPKWAGLYPEGDSKYLYVNRGFGYLAFPGRVGIWPEITQITLRKG
ncbi:MAG: hypothetical protein RL138_1307 [Bacteroidota bacterium]|jgi:predicted MPP superfamily phosphohydrolase